MSKISQTQILMNPEMEVCKVLITGDDKADAAMRGDMWSFNDLKKLDPNELLNRLESIDAQYTLMRWRIWWAIRQHFKSDKLFGQYINELKASDSGHASLVGKQQDIHRAWAAGKFCERHNITDLSSVGLLKSSLYALSRPSNADV